MKTYTLTRTEQNNLQFTGELLAHKRSPAYARVDSRRDKPNKKAHWFEIAVYRTKGDKYVLQTAYRFQGNLALEAPQDFATVHDTIGELFAGMSNFEPTDCVHGFPDAEHWAEKQETLMRSIEHDYDLLVESVTTELLKLSAPEVIE